LRFYHSKVELLNSAGARIRNLPGALAQAMVKDGALWCAPTTPVGGGPPGDGSARGIRFTRREMLPESGARVFAHHPRATDYE
jgi:hypothetical protein